MAEDRLYRLNTEVQVTIDGKQFIQTQRKNELITDFQIYVPVLFVRVEKDRLHPDDPVPGAEREEYHGREIKGPFFSARLAEDAKKEEEKKADMYNLRKAEIFGRVMIEQERASLQIARAMLETLTIDLDELMCQYHSENIKPAIEKISKYADAICSGFTNSKINENCFLYRDVFFQVHKPVGSRPFILRAFGTRTFELPTEILELDYRGFEENQRSRVFHGWYDVSRVREEFVSFKPIDTSQAKSIDDIFKQNDLLH